MKKIFLRWLAKTRLIRRYNYLQEVNKILEEYITHRIVGGGSAGYIDKARQDLVQKQAEISEMDKMLAFLNKLK